VGRNLKAAKYKPALIWLMIFNYYSKNLKKRVVSFIQWFRYIH